MQKWEEVWKKQFGTREKSAFDFTGRKIIKSLFQNYKLSHSWDIYNVEENAFIIVSSKIFNLMPKHWQDSFFIDEKEYQFMKKKNNDFEIYLLNENQREKINTNTLSVVMDKSYLIDVNEFLDEDHSFEHKNSLDDLDDYLLNTNSKSSNKNNEHAISVDNYLLNTSLKEKEKQSNFQKIITRKNNEIWESFFGNEVIMTDFAGTQITKYECDMGTKNSWKIDFYNSENDNQRFIAAADNIDKRAGRQTFTIDEVEYNIVVMNGKYKIISSLESDKILLSPKLLCKEIEKYFPSFLTNEKVPSVITPHYSSLLISISSFPIDEIEKLRIMLQNLLREIDVFQDIFIYCNELKNSAYKIANNSHIRIFFKSDNVTSKDIRIFEIAVILKNIFSVVINNIRTIYNLSSSTNFTMFLSNHNKNYKFISWFTSNKIDENEKRPIRVNRGELIVDKFYYELFVGTKGHKNSFAQLKSENNDTFFLSNIDINNMTGYIEEQISKNKNRTIW